MADLSLDSPTSFRLVAAAAATVLSLALVALGVQIGTDGLGDDGPARNRASAAAARAAAVVDASRARPLVDLDDTLLSLIPATTPAAAASSGPSFVSTVPAPAPGPTAAPAPAPEPGPAPAPAPAPAPLPGPEVPPAPAVPDAGPLLEPLAPVVDPVVEVVEPIAGLGAAGDATSPASPADTSTTSTTGSLLTTVAGLLGF